MQIHLGTRLASSLQLSGDFMSIQARSYGYFEMGLFFFFHALSRSEVALKADFSTRILLIKPYPGLDYSRFNLDSVDAVLHDLYHSGTACASSQWGDSFSLPAFIKRCREREIKVYLAPAIKSENTYESTRELLDAGAAMIWNTSLECAYAKLLLAYGTFNSEEQRADFLNTDIAGEHVG